MEKKNKELRKKSGNYKNMKNSPNLLLSLSAASALFICCAFVSSVIFSIRLASIIIIVAVVIVVCLGFQIKLFIAVRDCLSLSVLLWRLLFLFVHVHAVICSLLL